MFEIRKSDGKVCRRKELNDLQCKLEPIDDWTAAGTLQGQEELVELGLEGPLHLSVSGFDLEADLQFDGNTDSTDHSHLGLQIQALIYRRQWVLDQKDFLHQSSGLGKHTGILGTVLALDQAQAGDWPDQIGPGNLALHTRQQVDLHTLAGLELRQNPIE